MALVDQPQSKLSHGVKMAKIKRKAQRRREQRDLQMSFTRKTGILLIEVPNPPPRFISNTIPFVVNGQDEDVTFDANGKGQLEFGRSTPPEVYRVKIKVVGGLSDDQRLAFTY